MTIYLFLVLSLFSYPNNSDFCSCQQAGEINTQEIEDYDLILRGIVQKIETANHKKLITFKIKKLYKGNPKNKLVKVSTALDLSMCGLNIGTGGEWLLFAFGKNGKYSTNSCTRSGDLDSYINWVRERVEKDIVFLDQLERE